MKLTDDHIACLRVLDRLGASGCLTGNLAQHFSLAYPTSWATNRMRTLAKRGLVRRHESNVERWYITGAGLAALAARGGE